MFGAPAAGAVLATGGRAAAEEFSGASRAVKGITYASLVAAKRGKREAPRRERSKEGRDAGGEFLRLFVTSLNSHLRGTRKQRDGTLPEDVLDRVLGEANVYLDAYASISGLPHRSPTADVSMLSQAIFFGLERKAAAPLALEALFGLWHAANDAALEKTYGSEEPPPGRKDIAG